MNERWNREQEWKKELPQKLNDFFEGKNNEIPLTEEEKEAIRQQQEILQHLSDQLYEGLYKEKQTRESAGGEPAYPATNVKNVLLPPEKKRSMEREWTFVRQIFRDMGGCCFMDHHPITAVNDTVASQ